MAAPSTSERTTEYAYTPTVQAVIEPEFVEIKEEPIPECATETMTSMPEEAPIPDMRTPVPCCPVFVMTQDMVLTSLGSAFAVGCIAGALLAYLFSKPEITYVEQ